METTSGEGQRCHAVMNIRREGGGAYRNPLGDYIKRDDTWPDNEGKCE